MKAIYGAIIGTTANIFAFFMLMFGRKYTVAIASVLAFVATTVALIVCLKTIILSVVALSVIPSWIATTLAWFIPSNFISVTSSILSGRICRTAYEMSVKKIDLVTKAS
jgi:Family of unknown function (DUF5455)